MSFHIMLHVVRLAALGCALALVRCSGSTRSPRSAVAHIPNDVPANGILAQTKEGHAAPEPERDVRDVCSRFAALVAEAVDAQPFVVAVLPIASADGQRTPCSDHLADQILAAFLTTSAKVVDRESLQDVLREIDLGSVFDRPQTAGRVARADVLVVGRYSLGAGELAIDLKAVNVATSELIHLASEQLRPSRRIRQLAFADDDDAEDGGDSHVLEVDGGVRIQASYTEPGGGQFRLLDRVRQKIRRLHARYLRDAVGLELSADELDDRFRAGREVDCRFGRDTVTLEMEFGVDP